MSSITLSPLPDVNLADLQAVITGYPTAAHYRVDHEQTADGRLLFSIQRVPLPEPKARAYNYLDEEMVAQYRPLIGNGFCWGAYAEDGRLVALTIAQSHEWNKSLWVWEFHVLEEWRGRGVGSQLMRHLIELATAAGQRIIICETQQVNAPAIDFYAKMGFTLDALDLSYYTNDDWPAGDVAVFMKYKIRFVGQKTEDEGQKK